jgi:hypothetical protein
MSLIDLIKVDLENVYIFEMAFKNVILKQKAKIRNLQDKIAEHIILVKIYPHNSAGQHWEHELLTWFPTINRYTLDGKKK